MSDETTGKAPYDFANDPDGYNREDLIAQDYILEAILASAFGDGDDSDAEIALTVVIDGVCVSGLAISARAWGKRMNDLIGDPPGGVQNFGEFVASVHYEKAAENKRRDEEGLLVSPFNFLHMRDAVVGNGLGSYPMPLWRGSLRKLGGWGFGRLTRKDSDDS